MTSGHGGNLRELAARSGRRAEDILDFSASVNPLGFPECVRPVISRNVERLVHYPDPESAELVVAIAQHYRLPQDRILVANGSSEILFALARAHEAQAALSFAQLAGARADVALDPAVVELVPELGWGDGIGWG